VSRERVVWHAHARLRARQAGGEVGYAGNLGARSCSLCGALEQLAAWSWSLRLRIQWGSSRIRKNARNQAQAKNTQMKCEAAVAIPASKGLALASVTRQHARSSFRAAMHVCLVCRVLEYKKLHVYLCLWLVPSLLTCLL